MRGATDWQAAWVELGERIASKSGHGRDELLRTMAELAAEHRIPENLAEKALRVYGGGLAKAVQSTTPEEEPSGGRAAPEPDKVTDHGPPATVGGHDGIQHQHPSPSTRSGRRQPAAAA